MSEGQILYRLPPGWQDRDAEIEANGLEPLRILAVKIGIDHGVYTDKCEYAPDPEVWAYYRRIGGSAS